MENNGQKVNGQDVRMKKCVLMRQTFEVCFLNPFLPLNDRVDGLGIFIKDFQIPYTVYNSPGNSATFIIINLL